MPSLHGLTRIALLAAPIFLIAPEVHSQTNDAPTAAELAAEIKALKQDYETRIQNLEAQLEAITTQSAAPATPATDTRGQSSEFNPAIGVILNAAVADFSAAPQEVLGFQLGHESQRGQEGLALIETEFNFSANIDDKFFGSSTIGIHAEEDGSEAIELEEAYIQTLPGAGLPEGLRVKAGRAFWTLGYLNEHHPHADDFVDRPLPYRVFIDKSYNDNGLELAYVFPSEMYAEAGAGLFRGDDFPFGSSDTGRGVTSAYARLGNDIGTNQSFRVGAYVLNGSATPRSIAHGHGSSDAHGEEGHDDEEVHDDEDDADHDEEERIDTDVHDDDHDDEPEMAGDEEQEGHHDLLAEGVFTGDTTLYALDVRYTWAPTGNPRDQEVTLQGEYFWRAEDGVYSDDEGEMAEVDGTSSGWYLQGTYKFNPAWRIGLRYSRLNPMSPADITNHEYEVEHDPSTISLMGDWTNSEFGRVRLQLSRESLTSEVTDDQLYLQYIMSLGAHGAHTY